MSTKYPFLIGKTFINAKARFFRIPVKPRLIDSLTEVCGIADFRLGVESKKLFITNDVDHVYFKEIMSLDSYIDFANIDINLESELIEKLPIAVPFGDSDIEVNTPYGFNLIISINGFIKGLSSELISPLNNMIVIPEPERYPFLIGYLKKGGYVRIPILNEQMEFFRKNRPDYLYYKFVPLLEKKVYYKTSETLVGTLKSSELEWFMAVDTFCLEKRIEYQTIDSFPIATLHGYNPEFVKPQENKFSFFPANETKRCIDEGLYSFDIGDIFYFRTSEEDPLLLSARECSTIIGSTPAPVARTSGEKEHKTKEITITIDDVASHSIINKYGANTITIQETLSNKENKKGNNNMSLKNTMNNTFDKYTKHFGRRTHSNMFGFSYMTMEPVVSLVDGAYYSFNKETGDLTEYPSDFVMTLDFPGFIMPVEISQIKVGDVVLKDSANGTPSYYFVAKVDVETNRLSLINAAGTVGEIAPVKNTFFQKGFVVKVMNATEQFGGAMGQGSNPMMMMMMMSALAGDKETGEPTDNFFKMMMLSQMMGGMQGNAQGDQAMSPFANMFGAPASTPQTATASKVNLTPDTKPESGGKCL